MKLGKDEVGIVGIVGLFFILLVPLSIILLGNRYITWVIFVVFIALGFFLYYYDARKHKAKRANSPT